MTCPFCGSNIAPESAFCRSCGSPLKGISTAILSDALPGGTALKSGEYRVGRTLGQGGFGITYLGSQQRLQRTVALKEFFPIGCRREGSTVKTGGSLKADDFKAARERFIEEAKNISKFQHPGIVQIYDYFESNETAYMVMEYLRGKTLAKYLQDQGGSLPERQALHIIGKVAEALNAVHKSGLLHRDIKPDNILLTVDNRVVLIDFGSARGFVEGQTSQMTALVTHGYAPLEQYGKRAKFGPYTDAYALGATLYHMLTGEMPPSAIDRAAGVEMTSVRKYKPELTEGTERAVMTALRMNVSERPQTISEWAALFKMPIKTLNANALMNSTPLNQHMTPTKLETQIVEIRINSKDGAEMVLVPAGEFIMGSDEGKNTEKPAHRVYLDGFWIYKTPVTVAQYKKYCDETGHSLPPTPKWGWKDDHPILNVKWHDANDYAKWAGVRLPTEAEWEKTARGTDGREYPWGNDWDPSRLQCSHERYGDAEGTAPVGCFPSGASPYGALDMVGNAKEWVADWYDALYYLRAPTVNPKGPAKGTQRVVRGGYWTAQIRDYFSAVFRFGNGPGGWSETGFRCALEL